MKLSLVLTTINVPTVLALYRKCDPDVHFYIMGDRKTPDLEVCRLLENIPNHSYYGYDFQIKLGYKCHSAIGPDCIQRRNIGFLEALKDGADAIYTLDDDNIPVSLDHFNAIKRTLGSDFNGIKVSNRGRWFDPGSLLVPSTRQRGMPWNQRAMNWAEPVVDAKIGVVSGLIVGDTDCDASTRIEKAPDIGSVHILGQAGVVVDPKTWTIFNSQSTAIIRELMPAFFMMPGTGRHDDVFGSLIVQRVARERGYHVHLGKPFCHQARNPHNLITDLRAEIDGMETVEKLADLLDSIILPAKSVIEDTRIIYEALMTCGFIPEKSARAGLLWLEDCEGVM